MRNIPRTLLRRSARQSTPLQRTSNGSPRWAPPCQTAGRCSLRGSGVATVEEQPVERRFLNRFLRRVILSPASTNSFSGADTLSVPTNNICSCEKWLGMGIASALRNAFLSVPTNHFRSSRRIRTLVLQLANLGMSYVYFLNSGPE